jgi:uncharacterized sodium:solute symporter family permease YidK
MYCPCFGEIVDKLIVKQIGVLVVACAMATANALADSFFTIQEALRVAHDRALLRGTVLLTGLCSIIWDAVIVGLLIFAIRRLRNSD